ncbi:hypothetical protein QYM36_014541 [Artemia franciscana]|uniref:Uncharacterized protein n=1 Tax=Artemia franciscana TaxID=6661 RepID=A0AA88HEN7_ARTSF|nr:hypothetical protein QYM36_014541 [Artemia franciscana]
MDVDLSNQEQAIKFKEQGNDAYKKKDFEKALELYNKAIELDSNNMVYYTNVAAVLFEQKDYDKCIDTCIKAVDIGRENKADFKLIAKAYARIGNAARKLGDLKKAKMYYEKSLSEHRTPDVKTLLSETEALWKEEERKAYVNPELAEQEKEKGNELFKKGQFSEALKYYTEAIKRNPDDAKLYSNRAACYTKLAAFDLGLKDCEKCLEIDPKFTKAWIRKGKILQVSRRQKRIAVVTRKKVFFFCFFLLRSLCGAFGL